MSMHLKHEIISNHEAERATTNIVSFRLDFLHTGTIGGLPVSDQPGNFNNPIDVKISFEHHTIFVSDNGNQRIQAFDLFSQEFKYTIDTPDKPLYMAVDHKDDSLIVTCENSCVYKYSLCNDHNLLWSLESKELLSKPQGIAVDDTNGNIFVSDSKVVLVSRQGKFIRHIGGEGKGPMQFHAPNGIGISNRDNFLIVTDMKNNRVQIMSKNGDDFIYMFGKKGISNSDFLYPTGLTVDKPTGNIIVCDSSNNRIQVFSPRGEFIKSFGSKGNGPLELVNPTGLTINIRTGELYVVDNKNNRIQIYK
ncbi:predicted protein [Naegleria gruberi]|uniref:Predicted protein n=1 Tax=Naegleria gruberi TaxID=5762 RepID=D2VVQ7_NAEGR|nr:uncharacterized protein NAEGRDRAFT_81410 [Naegleria gruberi]EFC39147.1 predicted protein [Naegleria gruberi]|eukprot:XP_002671891.1 predicted protein [Naegleria gruberi strain NEG-M]